MEKSCFCYGLRGQYRSATFKSSTRTRITRLNTFTILILVYHGPGSCYGLLRVFQVIGSVNPHHQVCHWYPRQADDKLEAFLTWRERAASTQTLQLKRLILSAMNVTLAVHEDEYKSVS